MDKKRQEHTLILVNLKSTDTFKYQSALTEIIYFCEIRISFKILNMIREQNFPHLKYVFSHILQVPMHWLISHFVSVET